MAFYVVLEVDGVSRIELEADTSDLLLEVQDDALPNPLSGLIRTARSMSVMPLNSLITGG